MAEAKDVSEIALLKDMDIKELKDEGETMLKRVMKDLSKVTPFLQDIYVPFNSFRIVFFECHIISLKLA